MITQRTDHRHAVFSWLQEIHRSAKSEKATYTQEKVADLAEPIFSMLASAQAADPTQMNALLQKPDFKKIATSYLSKNGFLNIGIPQPGSSSERESFVLRCRTAAEEAMKIFVQGSRPLSRITGEEISDMIERISDEHFRTPAGYVAGHGHATPILLREMLGLPGDADVCAMETRPDVLLNAAKALNALGVRVEPQALAKIRGEVKTDAHTALVAFHEKRLYEEHTYAEEAMNATSERNTAAMRMHTGALSKIKGMPMGIKDLTLAKEMVTFHTDGIAALRDPDLRNQIGERGGRNGIEMLDYEIRVHEESIKFINERHPEICAEEEKLFPELADFDL